MVILRTFVIKMLQVVFMHFFWVCLVGMASQVPWFVLPQVLACMSVVLHYFPLISSPASV